MAIAMTLQRYLESSGIDYEVVQHTHTHSSRDTAQAAKIPMAHLVKSVVFEDEVGYLMAVVPASHHVAIGQLSRQLGRRLGLATEPELAQLFNDCEQGAIPPIGNAYGMDVIMDDSLMQCEDVYIEAGDHVEVLHLKAEDFYRLMHGADHGAFCYRH
ncbi:MAG: YbaK/EbsC family protein [Gammaproteobacteria bacterium]|nr:YbaK/EbsC family protein [Gammaproteobacteria bacterium]